MGDTTPPDKLEPVPEVVAALAALLKRARSGEIRGFVMACECEDRSFGTSHEFGDASVAVLYLATADLQRRLLDIYK